LATLPERVDEIANQLVAKGQSATILVNNAGIGQNGIAWEHVNDADWLRMMDVNVKGVFWCSRSFGKRMIERKLGTIVNLGSMSATSAIDLSTRRPTTFPRLLFIT
jgi:NAD(P)-dependent dehydrogenase (short-subunit alcohol dehydrogenase family)